MKIISFSLSLLFAGALPLSARVWTDVDGREVEADYVSHNEDGVVMKLSNGQEATVPLARLSKADQDYVKSLDAQGGAPEESEKDVKLNWNEPWPDEIDFDSDPEIAIVEEDTDKNRYVYESSSYRFVCDVRLSKSVVGNFAEMFETSKKYVESLPLAVSGAMRQDGKFEILLFEDYGSYVEAGGPPGSAGVYSSRNNIVMVPLASLGVRKVGSGYMRDRDKSNKTLIHEIVHQLTPFAYYSPGTRGWFTEGLAEYCAMTPYSYGRFNVKKAIRQVEEDVTGFNRETNRGRNLGTEFMAPDLEKFMSMDYAIFAGGDGNFNYGLSALLACYFFHLDGDGDAARIKEYLKVLRAQRLAGKPDPEAAYKILLDGRSWDELEEEIHEGWRSKGVKINFQ